MAPCAGQQAAATSRDDCYAEGLNVLHHANAGTLDTPVVGGKIVKPGTWPDVVAVLGADGSLCSGTLIDVDLVLTAGHCIGIDFT